MQDTSEADGRRNDCIDAVVFEVLQRRLDGDDVPDEEIVAAHPELMPELAEELRLATELRRSGRSSESVADTHSGFSRLLTVRCPHCRQPVKLASDAPLANIRCGSCGSRFSLAPDATEAPEARVNQQLGHFRLVERLGAGNFGTVWKAYDTELDRIVAVKVPRRGELTPDEIEHFLREARAAAQLNHPNIVSVHEIGRFNDTVFIVSDIVSGRTLAEWAAEEQPTCRNVSHLCAKIADALQHAHASGVVHRDLKPQNVMIDADGEPHLMDFGLARRDAGATTITLDGHVLGTPAYMSPEQARGESHRADHRSDVYSLGVIIYELLTGELPFRGNSRMLIHQLLHDEVDTPRRLNRTIPKDLETICLKCLEKDSAKRYRSAQVVSDELRRFLRGEAIRARPISRVDRAWRWCRRKPVAAALLAVLALVAVAGPLAAIKQSRLRRDANRRLVEANINRAENLAGSGRPGQRLEGLQAIADSVSLAKELGLGEEVELRMRNAAIACMAQADLVVTKGWTLDTATIFHADVDPALRNYAFQSHAGEPIRVHRIEDHQLVGTIDVDGGLWNLRLSHNGRFVAYVTGDTLSVWEVATGERLGEYEIVDPIAGYAFGKSTDKIAVAIRNGPTRILALPDLHVMHELPKAQPVSCLCFGLGDETLAVCRSGADSSGGQSATLAVYNLAELDVAAELPLSTPVTSVALGPNGLLAVGDGQAFKVFDVHLKSEVVAFAPGHVARVADFDSSGDVLVVGDFESPLTTIWDTRTGAQVLRSDAHFLGRRGARMALRQPGKLYLAQFISADAYHGLASMRAPSMGTIHADNRVFALPGYDLRIWDLESRRLLYTIPEFHTSALFSPAGDYLYAVASRHGSGGPRRLYRWPYRRIDVESNEWKLGPPEPIKLPADFAPHKLAFDNAGTILAADDNRNGKVLVLFLNEDRAPLVMDAPEAMFVAVSPNGRWFATGTWDGSNVNLYDILEGRRIKQFPVGLTRVAFSPDGQYLLCGAGMRIDLKTWRQSRIPQRYDLQFLLPQFAVGGRMGIFPKRTFDATALLFDTSTWRPLGKLTGSARAEVIEMRAVPPDGDEIVVVAKTSPSNQRLDVWDLRAIRKQLAKIGLDWDLPSLPKKQTPGTPLRLTVDLGGLLEP